MLQSRQIQHQKMVLIVDDQEINRDILGSILEDAYRPLYAENGEEALEIMRGHVDDLSIVLLDLIMPVMGGFEVLKHVREDALLSRIPIIVLTADKTAELQALQMGAADFITKPFDMSEVIMARIGRIIELCEGRELISAAEYDSMTMLYTRNFFFEYASRLYRYHRETQYDAVALDIEQFHSINALNGRSFGDDVLRLIGEEIRAFLAGTIGIAGRSEADRFEIYCIHQPDYRVLLDRIQDKVNGFSSNVNIHLRMGVKFYEADVEPIQMFDCARAACNKVRGDFLNPLRIYDDRMRQHELRSQLLINDLHNAVEQRQLVVYYQPKYDIQCSPPRLCSAEALIRWKHPQLGMIAPVDFVPLFESKGLINVVDAFVWEEAGRQIASWRNAYGFLLPISVNLSRSDMFDPMLIEKLMGIVRENGLDYNDLKLEVTESAYTDNAMHLLDMIHKLRDLGFEIEMDDFGSGYSSLNMLSEMPIDVLKMDMKFIRNLENSETDRRLVSLVLDIARYLDVFVVAEGVEAEGQLDILREGGCNLVQGYYFSRPLPAEEFGRLIEREIEVRGTTLSDVMSS
ncbi:MAG: EAL domain-containing protein [Lachnospiraceae bacterium]|nr:EAL domain-containing protein [Lachnospiraceae bacterium]